MPEKLQGKGTFLGGGNSAPREGRTPSLLIRSQTLYPLSYGRNQAVIIIRFWQAVDTEGYEVMPVIWP